MYNLNRSFNAKTLQSLKLSCDVGGSITNRAVSINTDKDTASNHAEFIAREGFSELSEFQSVGILKTPDEIKLYGEFRVLVASISQFIEYYVDLLNDELLIASYYIVLTWVQDSFQQIPYLRKTGDYGTGKSRFLRVLGSISYKGTFASGASTISPIFHLLDTIRGTLILDEADFSESDCKSQITKILNNGFMKGFPVLRSMPDKNGAFTPRAFHVFGCKILATRSFFSDNALESRFISFHPKLGKLRPDIPITLPPSFEAEAAELRNKLLMFRFRNYEKYRDMQYEVDLEVEPRIKQILQPLFCLMQEDPKATNALTRYAQSMQEEISQDRSTQVEARVLTIIRSLWDKKKGVVTIKEVTSHFQTKYSQEYRRRITYRWIGSIVRKVLGIRTRKTNGLYTICDSEADRLSTLYERFNI
ncbi:MAG: hypothetical protein AAF465_10015 [Pseudomonadota bacterium]